MITNEVKNQLNAPLTDKRAKQQAFLKQIGQEGHARAMGIAAQSTARLGGVGIGTFMGVSTGLSAQTIYRVGTLAQQSFWLNALNLGIFTYGFALTEKDAGSDPRSMTTSFVKESGPNGETVYRLNGDKKFIGNAARVVDAAGNVVHRGADFLLVFAVDDPQEVSQGSRFSLLYGSPLRASARRTFAIPAASGTKPACARSTTAILILKNVIVPECCLFGHAGRKHVSQVARHARCHTIPSRRNGRGNCRSGIRHRHAVCRETQPKWCSDLAISHDLFSAPRA